MSEYLSEPIEESNAPDGDLPDGWMRVPSRSRPGEYSYENSHTGERQSELPQEAASTELSEPDYGPDAIPLPDTPAPALPAGWVAVPSVSRPGEWSFESVHTGERYAEMPDAPAEPLPEGWIRVSSRSRPGEFSFESVYTGERVADVPETPAPRLPEGWVKVASRSRMGECSFQNATTGERYAEIPTGPALSAGREAANEDDQTDEDTDPPCAEGGAAEIMTRPRYDVAVVPPTPAPRKH